MTDECITSTVNLKGQSQALYYENLNNSNVTIHGGSFFKAYRKTSTQAAKINIRYNWRKM